MVCLTMSVMTNEPVNSVETLKPVSAFCGLTDAAERSTALFKETGWVNGQVLRANGGMG